MSELQKKRLLQKEVGKQMKLYYFVLCTIYLSLTIVFHDSIIISVTSIVPVILILLSIIQAGYFHNHRSKKDFNINNDAPIKDEEWEKAAEYMRNSYMIIIPLFVPFILFFSTWGKVVSLILYFIGFSAGIIYYRIRNYKVINQRMNDEKSELKEQIKREELGKYK